MSLRTRHLPQTCLLLSGIALACASHAQNSAEPTAAHQQTLYQIDIPAQALSSALVSLGRQTGLQISADSSLLQGLAAPRIKAQLSPEQALQRLLANSGLDWHFSHNGSVMVNKRPLRDSAAVQLSNTYVEAQAPSPQGQTRITRQQISALPAGNGDITSLLKIHPNVQFDNSQQSSKSPGEISPANISINGAKHYQNAFRLDGFNINNDIDPGTRTANGVADEAPGRSQGLAIDTDLLDEILVLDSNVPAAYGGFTGGVIEATTRAPSKDLHGKFSTQWSKSKWTRYHIEEGYEDDFAYGAADDEHPEFDKIIYRGTLEGHLTENVGVLTNFSQKRAVMPTGLYSANNVSKMGFSQRDQERRIDNYFLKGVWQASDRWLIESSLTHAPEESLLWRSNMPNSAYINKQGGDQVSLRAVWEGDIAKVEQKLAWGRLEQSRDSEQDNWYTWRKSTSKPWGPTLANAASSNSIEGGNGDIELQQNTWQYSLQFDWQPIHWLGLTHNLQNGLELTHQTVSFERLTDNHTYVNPTATNTCTKTDGSIDPLCSMGTTVNGWNGQYLRTDNYWAAGSVNFNLKQWAAYLQDEVRGQHFMLRPGVRIDADDYMQQTTVAPRLALEILPWGDRSTVFTAGVNRYYGRNITSLRLEEERNLLFSVYNRTSINSPWVQSTAPSKDVKFSELNVPYDDELTFGIAQQWRDTEFALKYVQRKGRDQIVKSSRNFGQLPAESGFTNNYAIYTNDGESQTNTLTFTVTPLTPFDVYGTQHSGQVALDWTQSESSSPEYSASASDNYINGNIVFYQGQFIDYRDLPSDNYYRPWTARLTTISEIPQLNLTLTNFFRYRAAYSALGQSVSASRSGLSYNGEGVPIYDEFEYSNALTWDMRIAWEMPTAKNQAIFVNLDVTNVTDRVIAADRTTVTDSGMTTYEVGRQFMVEAGYRF